MGRGPRDALCVLFTQQAAKPRLECRARTRDGFAIAEENLRVRVICELLGLRQAGLELSSLFEPERDLDYLLSARDLAGRDLAVTP